ncbi:adenosylcobinamide-GDP ribazoletransferase [Desulfonatronovibrio magnus]|uniref:adenosylcobinamide-GDP ribazoletransferase n=1 Tax=Desulfonatronovibrio magnus TaxID=698827 RepID=UPI001E34C8DC|nr:adenosylcobinamide-GDP ribazoletransferase [Desulfonatronovibrio magnus]
MRSFLFALSFLSILAPARVVDQKDIAGSLYWFTIVGLIIGVVITLPLWLGIAAGSSLVQAWITVGLGFLVTRGLHWDGWADLWDGWAAQPDVDKFWLILKDSRVGAFGVMGIVTGMTGQIVLVSEVIAAGQWAVIVWALGLGRCSAVIVAYVGKRRAVPGLGNSFLAGTGAGTVLFNIFVLCLFAVFILPIKVTVLSAVFMTAGIIFLHGLGKKYQGINGDFLGAAVIWGELSALLAFVV